MPAKTWGVFKTSQSEGLGESLSTVLDSTHVAGTIITVDDSRTRAPAFRDADKSGSVPIHQGGRALNLHRLATSEWGGCELNLRILD